MTVEIRALRKTVRRESFGSGDEALDLYFRRYAGQNQFRHHLGVTYVAIEDERVLGFVTVSPGSLDAEELPSGRPLPPYPVPILRVARLAIDESARGRRLGEALLRFSIELAEQMRDEFGCVGLLVDAKPGAVKFYERYGFQVVRIVEGATEQKPDPIPLFLGLGSVPPRKSK